MPHKLKSTPIIQGISNVELGRQIASIRKAKGITQIGLAEAIGIDQRLISSYETGRIMISAEMLSRIVKALSISSDTLLNVSEVKNPEGTPSLKISRRLNRIERLPLQQQKALLKNIDMFLKAAESEA